ncbi:MAG TPA: FhaA domain-containing protein, partial [Blastocatellia bacterium]|nr:FhaA domain-containing protein [Blastocatellia bacterium]
IAKVAPNHFKIGLTYEEASKLTSQQIEALSKELNSATHEFIHNRRYTTLGPIDVQIASDLFATSTTIKADFDPSANFERASGPDPSGQSATTPAPLAAAPDQIILNLLAPDGRGYRVDLVRKGAPAYIGRAAGNTIRLDDPSISRVHCSIALRGDGQLVISDLDSANGTFVNGQVVNTAEAQKLEFGDDLQIGDVAFRVERLDG